MKWSHWPRKTASFLFIASITFPLISVGLTAQEVYQKVKDSVYTLYSVDPQSGVVRARGSAIATSKTTLVTNCHIALIGDLVVKLPNLPNVQPATIFFKNEKQDLCLLKIPSANFAAVKMRPSSEVNIGEEVYAVGNPQGTEKSLSKGIISNKHPVKDGAWLQTDAAIYFGSSGGGLFDAQGNLIGITTKMGGNFGFAIPTEWITNALAQMPVKNIRAEKNNFDNSPIIYPDAISALSFLGTYGLDKIGLYRNNKECFLLIPGTDTNGDLASAILWNPKYDTTLIVFPSTASIKEALSIIYMALLDKETKNEVSYRSKSRLYIAGQPYPLYGSQVDNHKYPFLVMRFSQNPRSVFLNSRAFRVVFDDPDPNIGKAIMVYHLDGVAQALSSYNANCF
ncbi:S1C family serine protease [Coxiella burnetii]|uniref:S1C family serine protease n=1 Tax=Coxiella burnetii TaxID=777 RepID=UPI0000ED0349|nr:serine protease [Coxiella burnetii]ACJ19661.1 endopeptidase [Coxiella burnetii CbuK_Q154]EAX33166.1 serine protease [Coxiella burnetii 'MSU Goat Q177']